MFGKRTGTRKLFQNRSIGIYHTHLYKTLRYDINLSSNSSWERITLYILYLYLYCIIIALNSHDKINEFLVDVSVGMRLNDSARMILPEYILPNVRFGPIA